MKKNWTALKAEIGGFSKVQLLGLVQDLYRADVRNQEFLHARFLTDTGGTDLSPYKARIKAALNPRSWDAPIKYREARKAISDYNKARGQIDETLELMLYYVKCGNDVTLKFGDIDETFYNSMASMFASLVKKITVQGDPDLAKSWLPSLQKEAARVEDIAWGYGDDLREAVEELQCKAGEV